VAAATAASPAVCTALANKTLGGRCNEAILLVRADPYIRDLVGGDAYAVATAAPWDADDGVGFELTLRLAAPLSVAKTALPGLYLPPGPGEYLLRPSPPVAIRGATSLTLLVNLSLQEIERVLPSRGSAVGLKPSADSLPITAFGVYLNSIVAGPDGNLWGSGA